jgi:hypothetical protein
MGQMVTDFEAPLIEMRHASAIHLPDLLSNWQNMWCFLLLTTAVTALRGGTGVKTTSPVNVRFKPHAVSTTSIPGLIDERSQSLHSINPTPTLLLQQRSSQRQHHLNQEEPSVPEVFPSVADAQPSSAEEIKRNIVNIETAKGSLSKMVDQVSESIKQAESQFKIDRKNKLNQLREQKILQAAQEAASDLAMMNQMQDRVKERRKEINKCLKMIYGGSNTFYWHMRDIL